MPLSIILCRIVLTVLCCGLFGGSVSRSEKSQAFFFTQFGKCSIQSSIYIDVDTIDNTAIHSIFKRIQCRPIVALKDLYISSPLTTSGSVMGYINAGFVLVLWLSSLGLCGGQSHVIPLLSLHNVSPCLHCVGFNNLE